ncbi:MAG: C10 family peptidase [Bacteroidales bacterium]|nr:C10 family peptidase [Bacteroidales bacterium]
MKKVLFSVLTLAVALCGSLSSKADPVDAATARKVAKNLFIERGGSSSVDLVDVTSQMPYRNLYFFKASQGDGFVILSADDRAVPVLGYSIDNTFNPASLPEHIDVWFRQYDAEIDALIADDIKATDEIAAEWQRLIKGDPEPVERAREKAVSALLTTAWGQGDTTGNGVLYNSLCPHSGSVYAVAGCVAIATAQVMKYWNHPTTGRGSHSYTPSRYSQQSANFGSTTYAWSSMPDTLKRSSSSTQKTAVATLVYHIGVATEMDYGTTGSGATTTAGSSMSNYPSAEYALKTYFKYNSGTLHSLSRSDYSQNDWIALLKAELDATPRRPIIYSGRDQSGRYGHAFVFDGYDNSNRFHVNWGWDGYYNGNFVVTALNPYGSGTGGNSSNNYSYYNSALLGIKPVTNTGSTSTITANVSNSSIGSVTGGRTYTNYSDTAMLLVSANEGYRFKGWTDGSKDNPRYFIVNDNASFTAEIERISGDTLRHFTSYSIGSSWGVSGGTFHWGVRFPSSALTAHRKISKVYFYAPSTGTYTLSVYSGGSVPTNGTRIMNGNVNVSSRGYVGANISSNNIAFDATQPLWIVLSSSASYPATTTNYSGNNDSRYRSTNGTSWSALNSYGSWMIEIENMYYSGNPVAITEADILDDCTITNTKGLITVTGAENQIVRFIDNSGRVLATDNSASDAKIFNAPASGIYLIQVGNKPAHKVVVKK